jgi:two-component system chemotaxis response regulator CheY
MNSTHFEIVRTMVTTKRKKLNSVLLIEDNEIDSFIHKKILESCEVTNIRSFESPVTALEYLAQTKEIPELILLDNNLSFMDGFEFIDEFRKLEIAQHPIEIFILSAFIRKEDIEKVQEKCSGFIEKPLTKEKLFVELDCA